MDDPKYRKLLADYDSHCRAIASATELKLQESADEKLKRRLANEETYESWFEYYFPNYAKSKCSWFQKALARTVIKYRRLRCMAIWYRSGAKSVHVDMGIPLYLYFVKHEIDFMLLVGETENKAAALLSGLQAQFQFNKRLISDYGARFQVGDWAEGNFLTTDGKRFMSLGFRQNARGVREQSERPNYIVVDDVDNKRHVENDKMMGDSVDYITEEIWGCFDAADGATERFIYANNNFHKNSITNRLKNFLKSVLEKKDDERKPGRPKQDDIRIEISEVCAVKDLVSFEPEWPEKTSAEYWKEKYESMPKRSFKREFMHKHVEEGKIFKADDMQHCVIPPLDEMDALAVYGDLSYKDQGDYKSIVLMGKKGRDFFFIAIFLRQTSRRMAAKWLYDLYEDLKLHKYNISFEIDGLFAQDEFVNDFDMEGDERGYYIPVTPDKRPKEGKPDRIESLSGHFERRHMFFNIEARGMDQPDMEDQFLTFEKGSKSHDDGPDSAHGAMSRLNKYTYKSTTTYAYGARPSRRY